VQHLTAELRTGIIQARRALAAAHDRGDADVVRLNEQRLRYLAEAAAEYGIVLAPPRAQAGGHPVGQR
jgi:hypothetical protein